MPRMPRVCRARHARRRARTRRSPAPGQWEVRARAERFAEPALLLLLSERPMHGYQLSRELGDSLGGLWRVSYGSLYPALRRLERP